MSDVDRQLDDQSRNVFDYVIDRADGTAMPLSDYRGKVLLLVNTASQCGFTPQYAGLQAVHEAFADKGFSVIAFPCNQFGGQEPDGAEEVQRFCTTRFGVSFPITEKIDVNGAAAHPLFRHLTSSAPGVLGTEAIKWNFTKFLVDRNGKVVERFAPTTRPEQLKDKINALI